MNSPAAFSLAIFCILLAHEPNCIFSLLLSHHPDFASSTCDFPAIFNFGDGNSDTGTYTAVFEESPPFYGQSYFNGTSGRASDGRIVIDFIAASLGKSFLHPYLDSLGGNFSYGVNFANLLATIAPPKVLLPVGIWPRAWSPFYLDIQYNQFKQFVNRSQIIREKGGVFENLLPKKEYFSKALYTVDIGQNDISMGILTNMSAEQIKASIPDTINRLIKHLKKLYDLGARSFWIHNTGPIGCLPYLLTVAPITEDQADSVGCAIPYNELSQFFNVKLKEAVDQLREDLPSAAITYVDIYSVRYSLFTEAERYGFKLPLETCCGFGGKYNWGEDTLCGSSATVNGSQVVVRPCEDPSERIIWDGTAYSEAADSIVFNKISTGEFSEPPRPLNMACGKYDPSKLHGEAMGQINELMNVMLEI